MPVRVPLPFATEAMRLARPVVDRDGHVVAGAGTCLDTRVRRLLHRLAIQTVLVEDADADAAWQAVRPLADEIAALDQRLAAAERTEALATLRGAITRHLARRAARLGPAEDDE